MHKIFGEKKAVEYLTRPGAYLIAIEEEKIAVVKTQKGYFLLGGGKESKETDEETIIRECMEEIGYHALPQQFICSAESYLCHPVLGHFHPVQNYYLGQLVEQVRGFSESDHQLEWVSYESMKGKLAVPMQNWALDECWNAVLKQI